MAELDKSENKGERIQMKMKIYNFLVNRHSGIRERYHKMHDGSRTARRVLSWLYLLILNFCYYVLFCHFLGEPKGMAVYEEKKLNTRKTESELNAEGIPDINHLVECLSQYDAVSFDIFDTLIFRPFSEPADLFYFLGERLGLLDLKRIRMEQEALARLECYKKNGHYEVTLAEIWNRIARETGVSATQGMALEQDLEMQFCYANPFMLEVYRRLQERGTKIIVISDMYLPERFLHSLLQKNGYTGFFELYVSCEYGKSKGNGELFHLVKSDFACETGEARCIHIGDNRHSDVKMAERSGFTAMHYPNVNRMASAFRPYDMSPVIGGAYRGIVDNHLYSGRKVYSAEYEYGFIYGGLFVLGYCNFIHEYCFRNKVDKLLFLSRDGDILKQAYDRMYPGQNTSYVYWSRAVATKLLAKHNRYDYFRRYLYHKVNQNLSIHKVLKSMELETMAEGLKNYVDKDESGEKTGIVLHAEDELCNGNVEALKRYLQVNFGEIVDSYREQDAAANQYFSAELAGAKRAVAVDIGWAGSGAVSLAFLAERVWKLSCEIIGMVAGTNTIHNAEPEASEIFLQSGKLVSYLFSQAHNRDVMKKHDVNKEYNVYWELLLSSPSRQFLGFGFDDKGELKLHFGKEDANQEGIREIRNGILDFVEEYSTHFKDFPYMFRISGRDAYAPMLLAAGKREVYLKTIAKRFGMEIGVG